MKTLKIGLPKGSLQETTIELFKKAGFNIRVSDRSYKPVINDAEIECLLIRAQEIPKYVEQGVLDVGLSGLDWIVETGADVTEISDLVYSKTGSGKVSIVIAVPENSDITTVKDLEGKRIATELLNITNGFLKEHDVNANVEFSWGATEAKVPELVDAIVDLTETGSSLRANKLKIIETILCSTTKLIANKKSVKDVWKKAKIDQISLLLNGALNAESKVGLKMNVQKKQLQKITSLLPSLRNPTVTELMDAKWLAVETIIDEKVVRDIIPKLKELGAEGIVEYPLNKVIY